MISVDAFRCTSKNGNIFYSVITNFLLFPGVYLESRWTLPGTFGTNWFLMPFCLFLPGLYRNAPFWVIGGEA